MAIQYSSISTSDLSAGRSRNHGWRSPGDVRRQALTTRSIRLSDRLFYRRWILANGWAEGAGLGTTLVLGWLAAPLLESAEGALIIIGGALLAVILGTLLEGVVVGLAQEGVLRIRVVQLPRWSWVWATAVGAAIAWLLGMIPSTLMALSAPPVPATETAEPGLLVQYQYGLAVVLGLVLGLILGTAQWAVLRRHTRKAARWLWANAAAWGVGMPLVFVGMDFVPWSGSPAAIIPAILAVCTVVGLVVGAIHGRVLVGLLGESGVATPSA